MATGIAGYSGTPLAKKLGIRAGTRLALRHAPDGYLAWLAPLPDGVLLQADLVADLAADMPAGLTADVDIAQVFVTTQLLLQAELLQARQQLRPDAALWVCWPKKSAKLATDVTEDVIRTLALPLGWVDIKVCAVSPVWSGLKLVVRKALR